MLVIMDIIARRVTEVCVVMTLYGSCCVVLVLMGTFIDNIAHYFDGTIRESLRYENIVSGSTITIILFLSSLKSMKKVFNKIVFINKHPSHIPHSDSWVWLSYYLYLSLSLSLWLPDFHLIIFPKSLMCGYLLKLTIRNHNLKIILK